MSLPMRPPFEFHRSALVEAGTLTRVEARGEGWCNALGGDMRHLDCQVSVSTWCCNTIQFNICACEVTDIHMPALICAHTYVRAHTHTRTCSQAALPLLAETVEQATQGAVRLGSSALAVQQHVARLVCHMVDARMFNAQLWQEALVPYLEVLVGMEEAEAVAKRLCDRCKVMGTRCVRACGPPAGARGAGGKQGWGSGRRGALV